MTRLLVLRGAAVHVGAAVRLLGALAALARGLRRWWVAGSR